MLYQKRGRFGEANERYEAAASAYLTKVKLKPHLRPLQALCFADHGYLCLTSRFDFDDAIDCFSKARDFAGGDKTAPAPFVIFTRCQEADAYRRLGRFGMSDLSMYEARNQMAKLDPNQSHPLSAATWKQDAWAFMEQCKFKEAAISFEHSKRILERLLADGADQYHCLIDLFHVRHGLALIERFEGRDLAALSQFRALTLDIADVFRKLDSSRAFISSFTQTRQLLSERYVNSLDRQADCYLFGVNPDYAEAADDYRRALAPATGSPKTAGTPLGSTCFTGVRPPWPCRKNRPTTSWPTTFARRLAKSRKPFVANTRSTWSQRRSSSAGRSP